MCLSCPEVGRLSPAQLGPCLESCPPATLSLHVLLNVYVCIFLYTHVQLLRNGYDRLPQQGHHSTASQQRTRAPDFTGQHPGLSVFLLPATLMCVQRDSAVFEFPALKRQMILDTFFYVLHCHLCLSFSEISVEIICPFFEMDCSFLPH